MEWLRQKRLQALGQQLQDPLLAQQPLSALLSSLQIPDSAATRQSFLRRFGCTPLA